MGCGVCLSLHDPKATVDEPQQKSAEQEILSDESGQRIRIRAILTGLALIPFLARWMFEGEFVRYSFATWTAPFYSAIFILFVFTILSLLFGRLLKKPLFNPLELFCIYGMVSVAAGLLSTDYLGILVATMGFPAFFATPDNKWNELFRDALPHWLMVSDMTSLSGYYEGNSSIYERANYLPWLKPIFYWSIFIVALYFCFLSMSLLLRKQWVEAEKLSFPIIQLPMAMAGDPKKFFSDKLMWTGFAIAGGITLLNGLHYLIPSVPEIPIKRQRFEPFEAPPWNAVGRVMIAFYFFAITLGFLMPLDLSISIWLFHLLYRVEMVTAAALGHDPGQVLRVEDQSLGAFLMIGFFTLYAARLHFQKALQCALGSGDREYDRREPWKYRTVFLTLLASLLTMAIFLKLAGMSVGVLVFYLATLVGTAIVVSRLRAELGFPVHDLFVAQPYSVMNRMVGTEGISKSSLGAATMMSWSGESFRSHPMPHQIESLRLSGASGAGRVMVRGLLLAGLVAIPVAFWIYLDGFYRLGAGTARLGTWGTGHGWGLFPRLESSLIAPVAGEVERWVAMGVGMVVSGAMMIARMRIVGFPLHPLAFAAAPSWGVWNLWFPIFIGSMAKLVVLKGGGLKTYRRAAMFFFGLMLGEFVIGCGWTIIGMLFGIPTYDIFP